MINIIQKNIFNCAIHSELETIQYATRVNNRVSYEIAEKNNNYIVDTNNNNKCFKPKKIKISFWKQIKYLFSKKTPLSSKSNIINHIKNKDINRKLIKNRKINDIDNLISKYTIKNKKKRLSPQEQKDLINNIILKKPDNTEDNR